MDIFSWQGVDVDGILVTLKLHPEGDLGEWLVKHSHASFASATSLSPPPPLVDRSSPLTDWTSPLIDPATSLVGTLPLTDHAAQIQNDSSLHFHSSLFLKEHEASQSSNDGLACESGEEGVWYNILLHVL